MVKPLVTFAASEVKTATILTDGFAARGEAYLPYKVDVGFPDEDLTKSPLKTYVQVEHEGFDNDAYPVLSKAQVRVNCWAPRGERAAVHDLASLAQGVLLAHTDAHPGTGPSDVTEDPTTGYLMVWFTALVDLRATQLA